MASAAQIIDGKRLASEVRQRVARRLAAMKERYGTVPGLAVLLVGDNPASVVYVRNKRKACEELGMRSWVHHLPADTPAGELADRIDRLNDDPEVHGILLQLPLPPHLEASGFLERIDPRKDVDGFHPANMGRLLEGRPSLVPCTPAGILALIDSTGTDLVGRRAVVVGRSNIVGKPTALLLLSRHATVTICHSRTRDLPAVCREADVLVAAVGKARMIQGDWIKPGAVVIDVGINRTADGKLTGDVDFEAALGVAGYVTPVPGGVGPMTVAMLMANTLRAAEGLLGVPAHDAF
ncbi:MAG: bifunctional methylenetetrahydrofolate dehydrogenase/methenyltetrahydrofolate cyclohydrolase FolD [Limnochordaceae bacterium]|nr:bifunctional methylenetetrahydrofolate dehydrogenase/methenyltetrahydrofolate cyclohydrolase FolD [Limnochordaceae bacterium]